MTRCGRYNCINDHNGFSIVELIICVAILAIATIPLMSAFQTSGRLIGKSQSYQNATSVAEGMMEEIKGSTIEQIKNNTDYGYLCTDGTVTYAAFAAADPKTVMAAGKVPSGKTGVLIQQSDLKPFFVFYKPDIPTNNGEQYSAIASIDATNSYVAEADPADEVAGEVNDIGDASDANTIKLPVIDRIDKGTHAVIGKEINRLDTSAFQTWVDNKRDALVKEHKSDPVDVSGIKLTKEVTVSIKENTANDVDVECVVRYYDPNDTEHKYDVSEKVYSATFLNSKDTRVYIFYKTAVQTIFTHNATRSMSDPLDKIDKEVINVKDYSAASRDKQRQVYFILQEDEAHTTSDSGYYDMTSGKTTFKMNVKTFDSLGAADDAYKNSKDISSNTDLGVYGVVEVARTSSSEGVKFITNLNSSKNKGNFYYNEKNDYIYEVEVFVYDKNGELQAGLKSTKEAR